MRRRRGTDRLAELERLAQARLPDSHEEIIELWSWCSIEEREALEAELVAAQDSDAVLAARLRCEAALLIAQTRRAAGWPREWWRAKPA